MSVSLAKIADGATQPSEWELDRRRTVTNPTLSTLTAHRQGLAMNDPYTLRSALAILAEIHPASHAHNRRTIGDDARSWAGHLS